MAFSSDRWFHSPMYFFSNSPVKWRCGGSGISTRSVKMGGRTSRTYLDKGGFSSASVTDCTGLRQSHTKTRWVKKRPQNAREWRAGAKSMKRNGGRKEERQISVARCAISRYVRTEDELEGGDRLLLSHDTILRGCGERGEGLRMEDESCKRR